MDALEVIKSWKDGKMERWMEINRHRRHRRRLGCNGRNQLTKACPLDPLSPIVPFPDKFQGKKQPTSVNRIEKGGHDEHSRWEASPPPTTTATATQRVQIQPSGIAQTHLTDQFCFAKGIPSNMEDKQLTRLGQNRLKGCLSTLISSTVTWRRARRQEEGDGVRDTSHQNIGNKSRYILISST